VKYKIEREISVDADLPSQNGKLYWSEQEAIKLPPNVNNWDLTITMRNGEVFRASGVDSSRWFTILQPAKDRIIIKPNSIEEAFKS
jgi:hypothetical protein